MDIKEKVLKQDMDLFYKEHNIWGYFASFNFKKAILDCASIMGVSYRSFDILSQFLSGMRLKEIGESNGVSTERARQILCKSLNSLNCRTDKYNSMRKENAELKTRISMLEAECKELRDESKKRLNEKEYYFSPWPGIDLSTRIEDLDFSVRARNCLKLCHIETLYDLVKFKRIELLKFRNFGKKTLIEIEEKFDELNLCFEMPVKIMNGQFVLLIKKE